VENKLVRNNDELIKAQMFDTYNVDLDDITWEEFGTLWGQLSEVEDSVKWGQALLCAAIETKYGEGSISTFAADMGIGESTAYRLRRTWIAFPRIEDRYPDMTFGHHALAAMTNDPNYWIEVAALHGLSTYALERKIRTNIQKTKAAVVEQAEKVLSGEAESMNVEEIELPANHNVPLAPTEPPAYPAVEQQMDEEALEKLCAEFICSCLEEGFLLSMVASVLRRVIDKLEGK